MSTFRLQPAPTFDVTVQLTVPGAADPVPMSLTCRHMGVKALDAWADKPRQAVLAGGAFDYVGYLAGVIEGWSGVFGADDKPAPYSVAALAQLLDAYPASATEIYRQYLKALTESRAKN